MRRSPATTLAPAPLADRLNVAPALRTATLPTFRLPPVAAMLSDWLVRMPPVVIAPTPSRVIRSASRSPVLTVPPTSMSIVLVRARISCATSAPSESIVTDAASILPVKVTLTGSRVAPTSSASPAVTPPAVIQPIVSRLTLPSAARLPRLRSPPLVLTTVTDCAGPPFENALIPPVLIAPPELTSTEPPVADSSPALMPVADKNCIAPFSVVTSPVVRLPLTDRSVILPLVASTLPAVRLPRLTRLIRVP